MASPTLLALALLGLSASAQQTSPPKQPQAPAATFRSGVDLVVAPVVVRDRQGRAVGGLRQEDFAILDKGKPQAIASFSVEKFETGVRADGPRAAVPAMGAPAAADPPTVRFVAYLFDDLNLKPEDLMRVRDAGRRHIGALRAGDRAALYTTSGQLMIDFSEDRRPLQDGLMRLMPRGMEIGSGLECPDLSLYQADLIRNKRESTAMQAAIQEVQACNPSTSPMSGGRRPAAPSAQQNEQLARIVMMAATQVLQMGNRQAEIALGVVRDTIKRMASLPGRRTIVLASPGFLTPEQNREKNELFDQAIHAEVVINALDARGLYVDPGFDISKHVTDPEVMRIKAQYANTSARLQASVLAELANGTGGSFYENNNDLDEGFRQVAGAPEYIYLIGFSPIRLKLDGSFHPLKVQLQNKSGLSVQVRKGYYAVKP
jgi:VWFA-related protein